MLTSPVSFLFLQRPVIYFSIRVVFGIKFNQSSNKSCSCKLYYSKKLPLYSDFNKQKNQHNKDGMNKMKIVSLLKFERDSHATPFYQLPASKLLHIYRTTKNDQENGYCTNRLYYIASQIKCPPSMLSERLAKRTFVYDLSFDWLEKSLKVLLDKGISPDRVLRDLWVLKYHHKTIDERLQAIKDLGIEPLYPWMVRCSKDILKRYIEIYQETKTILGDNKSNKMYLAKRLNTNLKVVEEMNAKVCLERMSVSKMKNFLDFLISEGISLEEIINKPRILNASQITVKRRLEALRNLGLKEINLNILCRSKKDFKKYYECMQSACKDKK
ncbi:unnamed protein product [Leptosia nina]|uniref:Transcription termination factor, mitochondrial n=1 Tax=Leptosia nina TaxID=320188 RepID=A0AAV1JJX4_9NEOP